jgi:hypothetical protein
VTARRLIDRVLAGTDPRALVNVLAEQGDDNKSLPIEHPRVAAFDVDGTILSYDGDPDKPGVPLPGILDEMRKIKDAGWLIAIWTCRGDVDKVRSTLERHQIPFDFINDNPHGPPDSSNKIFAHVYVDDRAIAFDGNSSGLADRVINFKPWYFR